MPTQSLIRAADIFFTAILLVVAVLGVTVAWMCGEQRTLTVACLLVSIFAPAFYRPRKDNPSAG